MKQVHGLLALMTASSAIGQGNPGFASDEFDGVDGLRLIGTELSNFGAAVAGVGDINGDGIDDVAVGAPQADPASGAEAGVTYIFFGQRGGFQATISADDLDGTNGFALIGEQGVRSGQALDGGHDLDGDGRPEILIGAPRINGGGTNNAGGAYVFSPGTGPWPAVIDLASPPAGTSVLRINGVRGGPSASPQERVGEAVAFAPDTNGDQVPEIVLVGRGLSGPEFGAYVVYGGLPISGSLSLGDLDGTNGFRAGGQDAGGGSGDGGRVSAAGLGDINGDGLGDIIVGNARAIVTDPDLMVSGDFGAAYVIFGRQGPVPAETSLNDLSQPVGFRLEGIATTGVGASVAGGDVTGDGIPDILIGATGETFGGANNAGVTYIVAGRDAGDAPFADRVPLSAAGTVPFLGGPRGNDRSGRSIAVVGDVNGDQIDDIVIGAFTAQPMRTGRFFVIYPEDSAPLGGPLETTGRLTFAVFGPAQHAELGSSVAAAGDFDDDGRADVIAGAPVASQAVILLTECPATADTNGDGALDPADFTAWVIAFNAQAPACDQNRDGLCDPSDFNAWITNFNSGCGL
ncbi:MAG: GC-type dockerin domain-anchored protein [Planctomycetota bacterium]